AAGGAADRGGVASAPKKSGGGISAAASDERSNLFLAQLIGDVVGLAYRQGHDGERRILRAARRELAAVGDEKGLYIMGFAPLGDDAITRILGHAVGAEIVRRGIGRRVE